MVRVWNVMIAYRRGSRWVDGFLACALLAAAGGPRSRAVIRQLMKLDLGRVAPSALAAQLTGGATDQRDAREKSGSCEERQHAGSQSRHRTGDQATSSGWRSSAYL